MSSVCPGPGCQRCEWDAGRIKPGSTLSMSLKSRDGKRLSDVTFGVWGWIFGLVFFPYLPQMENFSAHTLRRKSWEQGQGNATKTLSEVGNGSGSWGSIVSITSELRSRWEQPRCRRACGGAG